MHEDENGASLVGDAVSKVAPRYLELKAFVRVGERVELNALAPGAVRAVATNAYGASVSIDLAQSNAFDELTAGTWQVDVLNDSNERLEEELVIVGEHPGERPVHAFVSSYEEGAAAESIEWLRELRATVVQFYDWMASYCAPVGSGASWEDPSRRSVSREQLSELTRAVRGAGAVAHAYAPIYAADLGYAAAHREEMLYRGDGQLERLFDAIQLANPANAQWQEQFVAAYGAAADELGFNGFHVDTYGYPRAALDASGDPVDMERAYESFLEFLRARRPFDLISFNQVNGVPSAMALPDGPLFRYCEVWPPNSAWRHLESLMDRTSGRAGRRAGVTSAVPETPVRGSLACYPPVWGRLESPIPPTARGDSLRTVVCSEAISTMLGVSLLVYGDQRACLSDAYYPQHERLSSDEAATVLEWHRFALRCRDLFLDGEDTSWYEIGDCNGAVSLECDGPVAPEPVGGAVFARVVSRDDYLVLGVLDLTGSVAGLWSEPTAPGSCRNVRARILRDRPERWSGACAVLGAGDGRFTPVESKIVEHREGLALEVELPVVAGWSVLRLLAYDE
ncbi:MAG: glycoside hydrolase family 66 protein [Acidimicrobiales bacterium]